MRISIITVTFNSAVTLLDTFYSIKEQTYDNTEYIVIDGGSTDSTLDLIKANLGLVSTFISQPDFGIYDAMNKGLALATGDIVGFLHSDDLYADSSILSKVIEVFKQQNLDALYGDVVYFHGNDPSAIVRRYRSNHFSPGKIAWGWMPAHPSLFLKKRIYEKYGNFKIDYKIAGDYEFVARIFRENSLRYCYLPEVLVKMRMGGISTGGFLNSIILNKEVLRACNENNIPTNIFKILSKYPLKIIDSIFQK
jgi:glycosyltransferase involved in cell wall biosynthesis